jgi:hypothetical protein
MKQPAQKLTAPRNEDEVSRRSFLTGAGATAGGVMLQTSLAASTALAEKKADAAIIGPDAVPLPLRINGAVRTIAVPPHMTLAEALRGPLARTDCAGSSARSARGRRAVDEECIQAAYLRDASPARHSGRGTSLNGIPKLAC